MFIRNKSFDIVFDITMFVVVVTDIYVKMIFSVFCIHLPKTFSRDSNNRGLLFSRKLWLFFKHLKKIKALVNLLLPNFEPCKSTHIFGNKDETSERTGLLVKKKKTLALTKKVRESQWKGNTASKSVTLHSTDQLCAH